MSDKLLFFCRVCGIECDSHPVTENEIGETIGVQAVCPDHCEDHDYERDSGELYCKHCGANPPDDWYNYDDDVLLFGGLTEASQPVGVPLSSLNGNASDRHKDPAAWDRWIAFSEANGHP